MPNRLFILSILLLISQLVLGQNVEDTDPVVDSLLQEYATATSDTAKFSLCVKIGQESVNIDTILKYSKIGISLFDGKDSLNLAHLYNYLGYAQGCLNTYKDAIDSFNKALYIYKKFGETSKEIILLTNLSIGYNRLHDYKNTWSSLFKAKKIAEQSTDTHSICICYQALTELYNNLGMRKQGYETAKKGFDLAKKSNNNKDASYSASYISQSLAQETYTDTLPIKERIKWAYTSLEYFNKDKAMEYYYIVAKGNAYACLVESYIALAKIKRNNTFIDSAEYYIDKVYELIDDDFWYLHYTACIKDAQGDYKAAVKLNLQSLDYAKEKEGYEIYIKDIYHNLHNVYAKLDDYKNALKYYELYKTEQDLVSGTQPKMEAASFNANAEIEVEQNVAEYEHRLSDKELNDTAAHFKRMIIVSIIGLIALLAIILIILKISRSTKKANKQLINHNLEIEIQNQGIKAEKEKVSEINEKILQSMTYAVRIQTATLSSKEDIKNVFPDASLYYKTHDVLSGDWYYTAQIGTKKILAVGGSAKFGIPGALICMITINILKECLSQIETNTIISPSSILRAVKQQLPETAQNNAAGISLCIFGNKTIKYAGINQNAILVKDNNPIEIKSDMYGDSFFTVTEGDLMVLYSDSTKKQLINNSQTPEIFCKKMATLNPEEQYQMIEETLYSKQTDDITMVAVKI